MHYSALIVDSDTIMDTTYRPGEPTVAKLGSGCVTHLLVVAVRVIANTFPTSFLKRSVTRPCAALLSRVLGVGLDEAVLSMREGGRRLVLVNGLQTHGQGRFGLEQPTVCCVCVCVCVNMSCVAVSFNARLFTCVLRPIHSTCCMRWTSFALGLLARCGRSSAG